MKKKKRKWDRKKDRNYVPLALTSAPAYIDGYVTPEEIKDSNLFQRLLAGQDLKQARPKKLPRRMRVEFTMFHPEIRRFMSFPQRPLLGWTNDNMPSREEEDEEDEGGRGAQAAAAPPQLLSGHSLFSGRSVDFKTVGELGLGMGSKRTTVASPSMAKLKGEGGIKKSHTCLKCGRTFSMAAGLGRHRKACARTNVPQWLAESNNKNNDNKAEVDMAIPQPQEDSAETGVTTYEDLSPPAQQADGNGSQKLGKAVDETMNSKKDVSSLKKLPFDRKVSAVCRFVSGFGFSFRFLPCLSRDIFISFFRSLCFYLFSLLRMYFQTLLSHPSQTRESTMDGPSIW